MSGTYRLCGTAAEIVARHQATHLLRIPMTGIHRGNDRAARLPRPPNLRRSGA